MQNHLGILLNDWNMSCRWKGGVYFVFFFSFPVSSSHRTSGRVGIPLEDLAFLYGDDVSLAAVVLPCWVCEQGECAQ